MAWVKVPFKVSLFLGLGGFGTFFNQDLLPGPMGILPVGGWPFGAPGIQGFEGGYLSFWTPNGPGET